MAGILACRVCLADDVKLYNMYKYQLKKLFENLTGLRISALDDYNYPKYLCAYCAHLLVKSYHFKMKCLQTQDLLKHTLKKVMLTSEHINIKPPPVHTFPAHSLSLSHPHVYLTIDPFIPLIEGVTDLKKKDSIDLEKEDSIDLQNEHWDQSDEEPLIEKINIYDDNIETSVITDAEFENDDFDKHSTYSEFEFENERFESEPFQIDNAYKYLISQYMEMISLSKEEQMQEVLERKESFNYINGFYKCELCFKGFLTDVTFKNHMLRHDSSSGPHTCDICHTRHPNSRSLKNHKQTSHERKYICKQCSHTMRTSSKAIEHIKWHNGYKFICKICGASFDKSSTHNSHLRLKHPSKFTCDHCGESFVSLYGIRSHKRMVHRNENLSTNSLHPCTLCNVKFKNTEALNHHNSLSDNGICDTSQSPCTECGENFSSEDSLKEHQESLHKHGIVKCDECDRSFINERSFEVHHQRVHLGIKAKYKRKQVHKIRFVCEICGRKCTTNTALLRHQRMHTGEKPYQCTECPKKFSMEDRLQIHLRTHTGERPFKCLLCCKAFRIQQALKKHVRVHTGEKPYKCLYCPKSFIQSYSRKVHVRRVHMNMPTPYRKRGKIIKQ